MFCINLAFLPRTLKRAQTGPLAGEHLFGLLTADFVKFFFEKQTKEAQLGNSSPYLHGSTAYNPKVIQAGKTINPVSTRERSFRKPKPPPTPAFFATA